MKRRGRGRALMLDNTRARPSFETLRLGAWTIGIVASGADTLRERLVHGPEDRRVLG